MTIQIDNVDNSISAVGTETNIAIDLQPKGTGALNLAAGSSGVNLSNGGTVTAITRTNAGTSFYTSQPSCTVTAPTTAGGVQATGTANMYADQGTTVSAGGTGYTVGDVLTLVGGTPLSGAATYSVATVSAGVVLTVTAVNFAAYSVLPSSPVSTTGGTGTGCTLNVQWKLNNVTITNAGSGYIEQPTVTFSGGGGSGAAAYAIVGSQTIVKSLGTTTGTITNQSMMFQTPSGNALLLRDSNQATPDAHLMVQSTANGYALVLAEGSNANASMYVGAKGSGSVRFSTLSSSIVEQMRVAHTASAVNYIQATGAATGNVPVISAQGSDTNINLTLQSKGAFGFSFRNSSGGTIASVSHSGSATPNSIALQANISGNAPAVSAQGSDTNVGLNLATKGTGAVTFNMNTGTLTTSYDTVGNQTYITGTGNLNIAATAGGVQRFFTRGTFAQQFQIFDTASTVNYVQATGSATGSSVVLSSQGSDTNVGFQIRSKGTGDINLMTAGGNNQVVVRNGGNGTNFLGMRGGNTGIAVSIAAEGLDTNIPITLQTKGTGALNLAAGSSGVNISNGGTVTAITGTAGGSYTTVPTITISPPTTAGGVQATGTAGLAQLSSAIANGGTGYTVGDVLTAVGGTGTAMTIVVATVSAGVITGFTISNGGTYTVLPTNPISVTGGTGSGATFNVTAWQVRNNGFTITNAGSGYVEQPTITFSSGSAAAYATVGSGTVVKSLGNTLSFNTPSGKQFEVSEAFSSGAVPNNYLQVSGRANAGPTLTTQGGDTNINLICVTKGTGSHQFSTAGGSIEQFRIAHTASAVNFLQITGAITGQRPVLSAQGSDTNVDLRLTAKG
jgi:hypothetical protein